MNTTITLNRLLAVVALILAIGSLFISGAPLLTLAVIVLCIAVLV